ncbi:MAG: sodium:solute symporter family transporter [Gammaproteobacteria bacterium]
MVSTTLLAADPWQLGVFTLLCSGLALATWLKVRSARAPHGRSGKDVYLAGGGLSWLYVAGAITLTNLSTEQLVGMNGNQMLLLAWWEIAGFFGLLFLAFVFVPVYYRYQCTTVTELLERRYGGGSIRRFISGLFLFGNVVIYLPASVYAGALFLKPLFGLDVPLVAYAAALAVASALYTITGGLRAVAVADTFSGIGFLGMSLLVVFLSLVAVDFDLVSGVPPERLSMFGGPESPIPWPTLLTGMIFIQIFYWSTNQNITQKAMAAPSIAEARKGVLAAAAIRILVVPVIVVVPGVAAYRLFGDLGDATYGTMVAHVLPPWLSGAFAAMMASAIVSHTSSVLNRTVALWSMDFHERLLGKVTNHWRLATLGTVIITATTIALVPLFAGADSIINLLQQLNGLFSMPILSAFIVGLLFRGVAPRAAIAGVLWGFLLYAGYTFWWQPAGLITLHYIYFMVIVLLTSIAAALAFNRWVLGGRAAYGGFRALNAPG